MLAGLRLALLVSLSTLILCVQDDGSAAARSMRPYIAHFRITRTLAMPDGSKLTTDSIETVARDSEGRIYRATKSEPPGEAQGTLKASTSAYKLQPGNVSTYSVEDPAASTFEAWDSNGNRAVLFQYPAEVHGKVEGCWADSQGRILASGPEKADWHPIPASPHALSKSEVWIRDTRGARRRVVETAENLGTKTIGGFTAEGVRTKTEPLPGEPRDGLFVGAEEFWKSMELNLILSEESRSAESTKTKELLDLKLAEPDPALFSAPKGYSVDRIGLHQVACGER